MKKDNRKLSEVLEVSPGVIDDITKISCYSNTKVIIENYLGILEYVDYMLRINTSDGEVYIYGEKLEITELTCDDLMIIGKIHNILFGG